MSNSSPKHEVAALINGWIARSGFRKQQIAARAEFADYHGFYRAYLDVNRNLDTRPASAIRVVRAFSEGLPAKLRCSAAEAVTFFRLTQLPLDGYDTVWRLGLFPADEWHQAINQYLSFRQPAAAQLPACNQLLASAANTTGQQAHCLLNSPHVVICVLGGAHATDELLKTLLNLHTVDA